MASKVCTAVASPNSFGAPEATAMNRPSTTCRTYRAIRPLLRAGATVPAAIMVSVLSVGAASAAVSQGRPHVRRELIAARPEFPAQDHLGVRRPLQERLVRRREPEARVEAVG